jgi:transcriptional regulator with XRE-family HTH domain
MQKGLYSHERETFRALLRGVREAAGLTQVELSTKLKRPQSYVSDYERGHRRLDWISVTEVLGACDFDLVEFAAQYKAKAQIKKRSHPR